MKNLHLLPTDKPSRIWVNNLRRRLELENENLIGSNTAKHIYITSDKKIKRGDYFLSLNEDESYLEVTLNDKVDDFNEYADEDWVENCKKIILTTDKELIADGVQAIDDEFLEWFVNNSSCEEVKIEDYGNLYNFRYLILIPQEEPKQETLEEAAKQYSELIPYVSDIVTDNSRLDFIAGAKWQADEIFKWLESKDYLTDSKDTIREEYDKKQKSR
jgi:hypothetical protein